MIRSMIALSAVDPGFIPQNVLTFSLSAPPSMAAASPDAVRAYYREAHARITQVPGIEGVSLSWGAFPMSGDDEQLFWLDNEPKPANSNDMDWALNYKVEPDDLKTMRIPLLRGRFFSEADNEHAPLVVVIDDVLARKFFGNDDPIGKQINLDGRSQKATVIGLVGHVMQYGSADDSAHPLQAEMYTPFMQLGDSEMSLKDGLGTDVVIRSRDDSSAVLSEIRRAMREMNQEQVIYGTETMKQIIAASLAAQRFSMILLGLFAGVALLLAAVGLYGVVSTW